MNRTSAYLGCALTFAALLAGCSDSSPPQSAAQEPVIISPAELAPLIDALPVTTPQSDEAKRELGRLLFWDPLLSVSQDIACASCHHPDFDYSDGLFASLGTGATGLGHERQGGLRTPRNAPTVVNTVFNGLTQNSRTSQANAPMFWDNRRQSLEQQAEQPLLSAIEMRGESIAEAEVMPLLLARLNNNAQYRQLFSSAFASQAPSPITEERLLHAIAEFQRSLVSNNSPFDRFMRGDADALSTGQQRGLKQFVDIGCANCHSGPMFSDFQLHILGAPDHPQNPNGIDSGAQQSFAFRTPTLRNLANTAPYAHSGTRESLREVLQFYVALSRGVSHNSQVPAQNIDTKARALGRVDSALEDILEFLDALNDPNFDREIPEAVPSGLPVGGEI